MALRGAFTAAITTYAFQRIGGHFKGLSDANVNAVAWEGAQLNSFYNFGGNLLTGGQVAAQIAAHAVVGGISAELSGGKFGHGFFSAGVTKGLGGAFLPGGGDIADMPELIQNTVISAVIGGTASVITGGKFGNGAQTGAMQYMLNQATKWVSREIAVKRALRNLKTTYKSCNSMEIASCARTNLGTYVYEHKGGNKFFGLIDDPSKGFYADPKVNANGARFFALNTNANAGPLPAPSCGSNCSVSDWFLAIDPGSGTPNLDFYQSNFNVNSVYIWDVGNSILTHHTYDSGQWNQTVTENWGGR